MTKKDKSKPYIKYAQDVVDGKIVAGKYIRLACKRFLDWFGRDDIYFDYDDVERKIGFINQLKHFTGIHNRQPFILLDWQSWVVASVFGFKHTSNHLRVIRNALVMIGRKNGKSSLCAALGLLCAIADNEPNAEIDLIANNRAQSHIDFEMCTNYCRSIDTKGKYTKRLRDRIEIPKTNSSINVRSSDSMGLDGYNSHMFLLDEMHAMKSWDLYNVMKSSQGMRVQPLAIVATTAGFLLAGYPLYDYIITCRDILNGNKNDDTTFAALYMLDDEDDWKDDKVWKKAIPSLGTTVQLDYVKEQVQAAINTPSLETGVRTKIFNQFCQSATIWIPDDIITTAMQKINIEDFEDHANFISYAGVDLSYVSDMTAYCQMFEYDGKFYFKLHYFLPESALNDSTNSELYKLWHKQGYLHVTSGNVVDYDYLVSVMQNDNESMPFGAIEYDRYNATQWAIQCTELGLPLEPFSQSIGNFSLYTKEFERRLRMGDIVIDYNPITRFCFQNASLKMDHNNNCKPVKGGDENGKIDGVIAMIQAFAGCLIHTGFAQNIEIFSA